jgi:hypothetical protein
MSDGQGSEKDLLAEKNLNGLAARNACMAHNTARKGLWQLVRNLRAVETETGRTRHDRADADVRRVVSAFSSFLDSEKTRDDYLASFLAEFGLD